MDCGLIICWMKCFVVIGDLMNGGKTVAAFCYGNGIGAQTFIRIVSEINVNRDRTVMRSMLGWYDLWDKSYENRSKVTYNDNVRQVFTLNGGPTSYYCRDITYEGVLISP